MNHGNHGLTAEQILRCAVIKQLGQLSYDDLMFLLNETPLYQSFCRIPSRSSVAEGTKAVSSETWEKINVTLVRYAASEGVEKSREVRGDCTVVESNIPKPFDSVLLYDSVRVITRILKQTGFSGYHDRTRSAKRRVNEIRNGRGKKMRRGRYEVLLRITGEVLGYARFAIEEVLAGKLECLSDTTCRLSRHIGMAEWVMDQTYRRLWRFRAGVESIISWLKRCFGLARCMWKSHESFKSYVQSSVFAANLATVALLIT